MILYPQQAPDHYLCGVSTRVLRMGEQEILPAHPWGATPSLAEQAVATGVLGLHTVLEPQIHPFRGPTQMGTQVPAFTHIGPSSLSVSYLCTEPSTHQVLNKYFLVE
jgi:hypothetical protein